MSIPAQRALSLAGDELAQGGLSPAVIGHVAPFEKPGVFLFAGEVVIEIAIHLFRDQAALTVDGFDDTGDAVLLQGVFQAEGHFAVAGQSQGIGRFVLPQEADGLLRGHIAALAVH